MSIIRQQIIGFHRVPSPILTPGKCLSKKSKTCCVYLLRLGISIFPQNSSLTNSKQRKVSGSIKCVRWINSESESIIPIRNFSTFEAKFDYAHLISFGRRSWSRLMKTLCIIKCIMKCKMYMLTTY